MSNLGSLPPEVLAEIKAGFFQECEDLLSELETGLLALKQGGHDPEIVNTVFRAAHSIKGGAASFALTSVVQFAHRVEAVLSAVRAGRLELDAAAGTLLLKAADVLADRVHAARDDREIAAGADHEIELALAALVPETGGAPAPKDSEPLPAELSAFVPIPAETEAPQPPPTPERRDWMIRFRPHRSLYANANEPLIQLRELQRLGPINVSLDDSELPLLLDLNPEEAYLCWNISLTSAHPENAIRDVFEFVEGLCDVEILAGNEQSTLPGGKDRRVRREPIEAVADRRHGPSAEHGTNPSQIVETIRVDLGRVDRLINLAGELVINQAMLVQRLGGTGTSDEAQLPLDEMHRLTRELQDSIMSIRAQPVKVVFQRMSRLVREVESATGKQVRLVTEGEATELDRTVIEHLVDPLTHMIRNAIDHGIELPAQRVAAGKPAQGTVRLSAAHRGGRVVIEAMDDGRGINRERVRAVATAQGLIAADATLNDYEIDNLIFVPGFSTADKVSEISGRGVGMDIVKRGVQALGGRISVTSNPGLGASFVLSLPLTLAVLDGMLVSVCGQSLVVPLTSLLETIRPAPGDIRSVGAHQPVLRVRGEYVPVIDLGVALAFRKAKDDTRRESVVLMVEDDTGCRAALLVDDMLGQHQVVIKSLETNYCAVDGISAATILGDGHVALIVNVNAILLLHRRKPAQAERRLAVG